MPERDLTLLQDCARAAGEIATSFFQNDPRNWEKSDDAGPVSEADLAVNRMLEDRLRTARPDYGWLSEESADSAARLSAKRVFIIDPIDGTRSFLAGHATWAHSLAIAEDGVIIAGVVFLPVKDQLYCAQAGGAALLNGQVLRAQSNPGFDRARVLVTKPVMQPENWQDQQVPDFDRHHRPSLAYRMALVGSGRFDAMLTLRPTWEWDIAAGTLIAEQAGARVTDRTGARIRFNTASAQSRGVVAGAAALNAHIIDRLGPL